MSEEGLACLAFEAHYNAVNGEGGWEAWKTLGADEQEPWLAVGLLIESMLEDARPSERKPEPAKVIIVTEAPVGDRAPVERRYAAKVWGRQKDGSVGIGCPHATIEAAMTAVAEYAPGAWLSVREDGALVPDSTVRALGIARRALSEIVKRSDDGGGQPFGRPEIGAIAADALNEIFVETE